MSLPELPAAREWASASGKFRINGKLTGFSSGEVQLLKESGNSTNVSLEKLSAADRQYVKDILRVDKDAKVIIGKVIEIIDGDTITVLDEDKKQHKIRLEGIDAPEQSQAFGSAAKKTLSEKTFNTSPWVEWKGLDKYDRILGHVYHDGRHINLELVAEGYAWHHKEYSKDPRLANAEIVARRRRLGLWSDSSPSPPWDFRRSGRE